MEDIFLQIVAIILLSTVLGLISKGLRQPLILAYILAGVILGPVVLGVVHPEGPIIVFSQIGVAFLLFLVGLNMSTRVFREVGRVSLITGTGQVFFTSIIGWVIAFGLGFPLIESIFIAIALSFSSTIIIVKLLSDKKHLDTLYGKISIGFLLIQDFIAIGILVLVAGLSSELSLGSLLLDVVLKLGALVAVPFLFTRFLLTPVFTKISRNSELLFLSGISWCFIMAAFSFFLGFSIEIGAFIAGIALASLPYNYEISLKIKPLRDFFLILFFVVLGSQITFAGVESMLFPALVLSLFVLVGNPLIVLILMGRLGYSKRTSFLSGLTVAQISEFSLVLIALGASSGLVGANTVSIIVMVGIITIAGSSYLIQHGERLARLLSLPLSLFERRRLTEKLGAAAKKQYDIVLVGCHEMGHHVLKGIKKKQRVLVVDFNPNIVRSLARKGYNCLYGDIVDEEVMEKIHAARPRLIISTIPTFEDNKYLLKELKAKGRLIFVTVEEAADAADHYRHGADYVFIPHMLGGDRASHLLNDLLSTGYFRKDIKDMRALRSAHLKEIREYLRWIGETKKGKHRVF